MARKVPVEEAFAFYVQLGGARSYSEVAKRFDVSKRSIVKIAKHDGWQQRIEEIEAKARQVADEKAANTLACVTEKHLKIVRALESKALGALRELRVESAGEAARILDAALRHERALLGIDVTTPAESRNAELDALKKKLGTGRAPWEVAILDRSSEHSIELADRLLRWYETKFFAGHPQATREEYATKDRQREFLTAAAREFWQGRRSVA